jgi:hypothetical protein
MAPTFQWVALRHQLPDSISRQRGDERRDQVIGRGLELATFDVQAEQPKSKIARDGSEYSQAWSSTARSLPCGRSRAGQPTPDTIPQGHDRIHGRDSRNSRIDSPRLFTNVQVIHPLGPDTMPKSGWPAQDLGAVHEAPIHQPNDSVDQQTLGLQGPAKQPSVCLTYFWRRFSRRIAFEEVHVSCRGAGEIQAPLTTSRVWSMS